jgi:hypothetical protein
VASLGGFVQQYQVTVDPNRLKAYDLAITDVTKAVRDSNNEVGGRLLEFAGKEYMVRAIAESAYRRGAKFVDVQWFDPWVKRTRVEYARDAVQVAAKIGGQNFDAGFRQRCPDFRDCACEVGGAAVFQVVALRAGLSPAIIAGLETLRAALGLEADGLAEAGSRAESALRSITTHGVTEPRSLSRDDGRGPGGACLGGDSREGAGGPQRSGVCLSGHPSTVRGAAASLVGRAPIH